MSDEPYWPSASVALQAHATALENHGGKPGIRSLDGLYSALARPKNHWHYSQSRNVAELTAVLAQGISENHPFIDGNKRTTLVVCLVFLRMNGFSLAASNDEFYVMLEAYADGDKPEAHFDWMLEWFGAYVSAQP